MVHCLGDVRLIIFWSPKFFAILGYNFTEVDDCIVNAGHPDLMSAMQRKYGNRNAVRKRGGKNKSGEGKSAQKISAKLCLMCKIGIFGPIWALKH